ncbi:sex-lethal homolog isoform X3 [Nomia melanderi]|uniref:sex-lethal homolog isoform X3 n=2 Tax=Nomia melanderi TaxID=2448451 RepID=UPI003FCD6114
MDIQERIVTQDNVNLGTGWSTQQLQRLNYHPVDIAVQQNLLAHQRIEQNSVESSKMTDQREQQLQAQQQQLQPQQQQQQQQSKGGDEPRTNLIINYLPQSMTEKDLYSLFVTIGPVESCRVMKDYKTGYSYGFGFVNYAKAEDAATAINTLNGLQVQNKRLKVSFARPSGEEIKETNLYVTNLPRNITESQIDDIFSKYGNIVQKNILKDKLTGLPRGVAFVRFDKREEAQEAIARLHGTIPDGGSEPLSVKIAEEHGKQKAAYYAGWQAGYNQSRVHRTRSSPDTPTCCMPANNYSLASVVANPWLDLDRLHLQKHVALMENLFHAWLCPVSSNYCCSDGQDCLDILPDQIASIFETCCRLK